MENNIDIFDNDFEWNIEKIDDVILKDTNTASQSKSFLNVIKHKAKVLPIINYSYVFFLNVDIKQ